MFRKHGDPQYKNRFEIPAKGTDQKSKEKAELVTCDVCSQVFPTISKAITHKHKVHPDHDAKYFCPWCGKLFTLKVMPCPGSRRLSRVFALFAGRPVPPPHYSYLLIIFISLTVVYCIHYHYHTNFKY